MEVKSLGASVRGLNLRSFQAVSDNVKASIMITDDILDIMGLGINPH